MKRNFVVSLFGSFIGFGMLLILLSAAGIVGARGADVRSDVSRANDVSAATPLTSTFTYQGQLINSGSPVNSTCSFQFGLWDSASGPAQIGITQTVSSQVSNGLFTVGLNFGANGSVFNGSGRWLQIAVRCPPASGYTPFNQRQQLTAAPYAFALPGLYTQPNATSPNIIGGYSGNNIGGPQSFGVTIGGGGQAGLANTVQGSANATFATIGGGVANTISGANVYHSAIGGGYLNTISSADATIGGGNGNTASGDGATVGGGASNTASNFYTTIGGGASNNATSHYYATVGGGNQNIASGDSATVGGGQINTAGGRVATVGGGYKNTASGIGSFVGGGGYDGTSVGGNQALGNASTIGGGHGNLANLYAATVGGGQNNAASNDLATVGGGYGNTASGYAATVGGGYGNSAEGAYSFAAGYNAHAYYNGSFVWGDSTGLTNAADGGNNEFVVHASGGIYLIPSSGNCILSTGTGGWACSSDRNLKENFKAVDGQAVLQNLSRIPISRWNSIGQDTAIQHIGPMAQDFYAAFNLGDDNLHINTVDAQGVAFAAIQGLYQENQDLKSQNASLETRMANLEQNAPAASFNWFNLLSLIAFAGCATMWLQQRRSQRGGAQ